MERQPVRILTWALPLMVACLAVAALLPAHAQTATAEDGAVAAMQLNRLAETGDFNTLLHRLRVAAPPAAEDGRVSDLIEDLQKFQSDESRRRDAQRAEHEEALARVDEYIRTGKTPLPEDDDEADESGEPDAEPVYGDLEDAIVAAIDAHALAENPDALLLNPSVKHIVAEVENQALAYEAQDEWIEALTMYRLLQLLDEQNPQYRDDLKRIRHHARVLHLYAPGELQRQYNARAERRAKLLGEDDPDSPNVESEPWIERLRGVEPSMLLDTLRRASRYHVEGDGYTPMVTGSLEALLILIETDAIGTTFQSLEDEQRVEEFKNTIVRELDKLERRARPLTWFEAKSIMERVLSLNRLTIDLPEEIVVYELAQGATGTLDDFSDVIWPEDLEQFSRSTEGKFYGVGIQIARRDGELVCVSPLANTPAQRAGIKAGDVIAQVDGRNTDNWSLDRAVREITGDEGTDVLLGIQRVGEAELLEIPVTRAEIIIESIRGWEYSDAEGHWDFLIDEQDRIAYVRLSQFIPQTAEDLDAAITQVKEDGPINGLILDLRFNPGGLLSSAVDVSDRFIKAGPIVFTVDGDRNRQHQSTAMRSRTHEPFPIVVLINQGSASASEIVAGALQDYSRAVIVGERSFGKGSVQDLFPLANNRAYLKLTTQYYMLPLGRIIHRKPDSARWGIEPDIEVPMTAQQVADALEVRQQADVLRGADEAIAGEDQGNGDDAEPIEGASDILARGLDPQLKTALLVLKTRLLADDLTIAAADTDDDTRTP